MESLHLAIRHYPETQTAHFRGKKKAELCTVCNVHHLNRNTLEHYITNKFCGEKAINESKWVKPASAEVLIAAVTLVCCSWLYSSISKAQNKFVVSLDQWRRCLKSVSKQISATADSLSLHILLSVRKREGSCRVRWRSWVEVTRPGLSRREPVLASLTLLRSRRDLAFTGSVYVTTNKAKG